MKIKLFLLGLFLTAGAGMRVEASENISNVQAMFIYNFLRHVDWPEGNSGETFVIGVLGDDEVFNQLQVFTKNRKVGTRNIIIRKLRKGEEAASCQLVFVGDRMSSEISYINKAVGSKPILLVAAQEGSLAYGSTIEFLIQDSKLKFRINEERAREQHLIFSRSLLDMAI